MGFWRSLRKGGDLLLGHWEELKEGMQSSSFGAGRSLRRGGELLIGLWEELKQGWKFPPWTLGGA